MRTYEELIAAQTELAHFNPNHDPKTGRFSRSKFGAARLGNKIKKNYYKTYSETEKQYNKESAHIDSLKPIFSEKRYVFLAYRRET